jgi:hypothetical protein
MPTHPHDLHLLREIQDQIQTLITHHFGHQIIIVGDFNKDVSMTRRTTNGTNGTNPTWTKKRPQLTHDIGHHIITTNKLSQDKEATTYTSKPHRWMLHQAPESYQLKLPHANQLITKTLTTTQPPTIRPQQYNYTKWKQQTFTQPSITYPIPPSNKQQLQRKLLENNNLEITNPTNR